MTDRSPLRRVALAGAGLAALAFVGTVAAAPKSAVDPPKSATKKLDLVGVDPAVAKQLSPRVPAKAEQQELLKRAAPQLDVPAFNVKHLEPATRGQLLGASDPEALPPAVVFDARTPWHDDATYMEVTAYDGAGLGVRPLRNYLHFLGPESLMENRYTRPSVLIHFRARAGTRYLLECSVDTSGPAATFFAADARAEYSVTSDDRATLLYVRDQGAATEDVVVQVASNATSWYFDGCELTASR